MEVGQDIKAAQKSFLTVTQLIQLFNDLLDVSCPVVMFAGELSQVQVAQSGHIYFTIKDEKAQISCVMWAGMARQLTFKPNQGAAVQCFGKPSLYAASGRFQVIVHKMIPAGAGDLQRRFLELKARLEKEGLFSPDRKRPLPFLPKAVGIVTSKTGAVIHDMMVKIRERFPSMKVYLADTRVQGEGAADEIAEAIDRMSQSGLVDVIIVARGGGSLEDLWAFNEEAVVRAVFRSQVVVVSGVGHEVDTTLCDLAADVRAPTPTAAAEMVVPHVVDLLCRVSELERRLLNYDRWFQPLVQRVDEMSLWLSAKVQGVFDRAKLQISASEAKVRAMQPDRVLMLFRSKIDALAGRLQSSGMRALKDSSSRYDLIKQRLDRASPLFKITVLRNDVQRIREKLEALNPARVVERGFAIIESNGRIITDTKDVKVGDRLGVRLRDGRLDTITEAVTPK